MSKKIEMKNCSELEDEEDILACKWDNLRKITEKQDRIQLEIGGSLNRLRSEDKITSEEFREKADMQTIFDHLNWIQKVISQTEGDARKTFKYGSEDKFEKLERDWESVEENHIE